MTVDSLRYLEVVMGGSGGSGMGSSDFLTPERKDEIGVELGVTFGEPKHMARHFGVHLGVYDEAGEHIGDIKSRSTLFTEEDLREKIQDLIS